MRDTYSRTEADAGRIEAANAADDREPYDPADGDDRPRDPFPNHVHRCQECGGRFVAADIRDRHEATCDGADARWFR